MISLTRFGCLAGNSCYGIPVPPPLGVLFPGLTQPRYPSELYEGLLALAIFGGLLWLSQRKPPEGTLFLAFLIVYSYGRAVIDLTRINYGGQFGAVDVFLSIGVALAAAVVFWVRRNRTNNRDGYGLDVRPDQSEAMK